MFGQCISHKGIKPIQKYVRAIRDIPNLTNLNQLRCLIGKCNCYTERINNHQIIYKIISKIIGIKPMNTIIQLETNYALT